MLTSTLTLSCFCRIPVPHSLLYLKQFLQVLTCLRKSLWKARKSMSWLLLRSDMKLEALDKVDVMCASYVRHGGDALPFSTNLLELLFKVELCFCLGFRCALVLLGWLWACVVDLQESRVSEYRNEPAHIFTNCLNILYLINTQTKHPTLHNSHPNKIILEYVVRMLQTRTQRTTLHKVKAHANISGSEQADKLAKLGCTLEHTNAVETCEHAHPTPYFLQKKLVAFTARYAR